MKKDAKAQNQPSSSPRRRLLRGAAAIGAAAAGYGVLRELNASPVPSPSATLGTERAVQQLVGSYGARLHRLLAQGQAQGELRADLDVQAAATFFIGTVQGLVMQSLISGDMARMCGDAPRVFAIYQRGIDATESASS